MASLVKFFYVGSVSVKLRHAFIDLNMLEFNT